MCSSEGQCGSQASCVAGRCVAQGGVPAIATARRLLFAPADVAYLRRGDGAGRIAPALVMMGRGDGALALLRFSIPLAADTKVLEAYLLFERSVAVDADPTPVTLRAARILDAWDGRSTSWARQPRVEDIGAPVTEVSASSGPIVRIDVRSLVQRWRRRSGADEGIALIADGGGATGMAFALADWKELRGPLLELYVR
jgi:hypothetical protein